MNGIIGKYMSGQYICLPDIDVGCPLSRMSDTFWNKERLADNMRETDAVMVSYALKALSEYLGTDWLQPCRTIRKKAVWRMDMISSARNY